MSNAWILPAIGFLLYVAIAIRRWRGQRLERIRASWAAPVNHSRNLKAIAESHASRVAATPGLRSLDERTWADLNLDQVFAAVDRTTSTLGQHALYHRLRSAPVGENRDAFEALIERLRTDSAMRERAQLALDRLQDPQGYDIWWLGGPGAVEGRWWYAAFPLLTAAAIISVAILPLSPVMFLVMFAADRHRGVVAVHRRR